MSFLGCDVEPGTTTNTSTSTPPAPQSRRSKIRGATGCLTCRARKVKCDEVSPVCGACCRLSQTCVWPTAITDHSNAVSSSKRQRKSCVPCQKSKSACSREKPSCARCRAAALECHYMTYTNVTASRHTTTDVDPTGRLPSTSETVDLGDTAPHGELATPAVSVPATLANYDIPQTCAKFSTRDLLDVYFTRAYSIAWNSYIHRPSFMKTFETKQVSKPMLCSICAVATIFVNPGTSEGDSFATEARESLKEAIIKPTIELLGVVLNLTLYEHLMGRVTTVWNLVGLAIRNAYALRLNIEAAGMGYSPAVREARRRLMWACFCWDGLVASGVHEFAQVPLQAMRLHLPCSENHFVLSIDAQTRHLQLPLAVSSNIPQSDSEDLLAELVSLMAVRSKIAGYVYNLTHVQVPPWAPLSVFQSCREDLDCWSTRLRPQMQLTEDTMVARRSTNQLLQLFGLHALYHQCCCDLHRIALYGFSESASAALLLSAPPEWLQKTQEKCYLSAVKVSEVALTVLSAFPDLHIDDPSISVCMYESVRVQMWAFQNLIPEHQRQQVQMLAIPRINAAITVITKALYLFRTSLRLLRMLQRVLQQTHFQCLLHNIDPTLEQPRSGLETPEHEQNDRYPSLSAQGMHTFINRVHRELLKTSKPNIVQTFPTVEASGILLGQYGVQQLQQASKSALPVLPTNAPYTEPDHGVPFRWTDLVPSLETPSDAGFDTRFPLQGAYTGGTTGHLEGAISDNDQITSEYIAETPGYTDIGASLSLDALLNWQWPSD